MLEEKILSILKSHYNNYISGSEIARRFSISRSMVNKIINSLRSKGFIIKSHPKLGYRLINENDLSKANEYLKDLNTNIKYTVLYMKSCTTTQDVAEELAYHGANEGTVVICETMSKGRGRLSRYWYAPEGGLWFTLVLRPPFIKSLHLLSFIAGLSVLKAIKDILNINAKLKWPNDVLINERKVSGILIEAKAEADRLLYALMGIGINVNNTIPEELRNSAISLKDVIGNEVPRVTLLRSILISLDLLYSRLLRGHIDYIIMEWLKNSATIGRRVRVHLVGGEIIEGKAVGVDKLGRLLVKVNDEVKRIEAGDVIHLR